MTKVRFGLAMSLDGYCAGPQQSLEHPLGVGGLELHAWAFPNAAFRKVHGESGGEVNASTHVLEESFANVGAYIMGRNMFGPERGAWRSDPPWNGWWGDDPPFHAPVFVLTHHVRPSVEMKGGTSFHFVSDGIASALEQARAAAGGKDVVLGGGASVIQQYLAAGSVDEINVSIAPILLGGGERLFDRIGVARLEQVRAIEAPGVTHIRYRVVRG